MSSRIDAIKGLMRSPEMFSKVVRRISMVVESSFKNDLILRPHVTASEIKERSNLCYDLFLMMRTDLHYSTHKALDVLPTALRSELDGIPWKPSRPDRSWAGGRLT